MSDSRRIKYDHPESDACLMAEVACGNRAAFDIIVGRYQDRLQRFATRLAGGDSLIGREAVVGAFLKLWEFRGGYCEQGKLEAWLLRATRRQCMDALSRAKPGRRLDPNLPARSEDPTEHFLAAAVREAVFELPEDLRTVLVLTVYEGLSYAAVAEALEIPVGTVASRKNQAVETLKRRLAAWDNKK